MTFSNKALVLAATSLFAIALFAQKSPVKPHASSAVSDVTTTTKQKDAPRIVLKSPVPKPLIRFCSDKCAEWSQSFAINSVRDLNVLVSWSNLTGAHTQKLRLLLPSGDEYRSFDKHFEVNSLPLFSGSPTIASVLPVSGGWIQQRKTSGVWSVELYLDGQLVQTAKLVLQ